MPTFENFNPDDTGIANGNYFGFPFTTDQSQLVLLSSPWDVTVSYGEGTASAPEAIIAASTQVEIYDPHAPNAWQKGIATIPCDPWIETTAQAMRQMATQVIEHAEIGGDPNDSHIQELLSQINQASTSLNERTYNAAREWLQKGKQVALIGGDHSTPLGLIRAVAEHHGKIGILHIDAHADLRVAYEGFEYSHASIMYNALKIEGVEKLVQVAIRDFSLDEKERAEADDRVVQMSDFDLKSRAFEGVSWCEQCHQIISHLPQNVHVSFDIDGLSPDNCPNTGTPVPGGLSYQEAIYLLVELTKSGRKIVGFDLTEVGVSPDEQQEWDANVGSRILYKLCNLTLL